MQVLSIKLNFKEVLIVKKLLTVFLAIISMTFIVPAAEAKTSLENETNSAVNYSQQRNRRVRRNNDRRYQRNRRDNRRYQNRSRVRTVYRTRYVRRGRWIYRETYRIMYLPNGRVNTKLVSRVRVRRY